MKRIAVLVHEHESRARLRKYLLWACTSVWESQGIEVETIWGAPRAPVEADVIFAHVNLTMLPDDVVDFISRHGPVVNGSVRDTSKSVVSSQLVGPGCEYDGPVIVKTDQNAGGRADHRDGRCPPRFGSRAWRGGLSHRLSVRSPRLATVGLRWADVLNPKRYPTFRSIRDVPRVVFDNPALVVERYVPEIDGDHYCLRSYCFLGDRAVTVRVKSFDPVVKASSIVFREEVGVDESIVATRHRLGFDYGKFDYVVHAGEAILLDANPTPMLAGAVRTDSQLRTAATLAGGISGWLAP
jgi:hypothetical protein